MKSFRVYHLAAELNIDKQEAVKYFAVLGVEKKNAIATLDESEVKLLRRKIPRTMRAYKLAEEFGIQRNSAVKIFRAMGFEIKSVMVALDRDQVRFLRELFHSGSSDVAQPGSKVDSRPLSDEVDPAGDSGMCSGVMLHLGGADSLPLSLAEPNLGKQVVALGTLIEALLADVLASRGLQVKSADFLALINLAFEVKSDELFPSVYRDSMHSARKIRNKKAHPKIGVDPPSEAEFLKARNVFLVAVADLLRHLPPRVASAVLEGAA